MNARALPIHRPRTVVQNNYFTGRTEAVMSAEIRARVAGYLTDKHFEPAQDIREGDVLFTIEKDSYQATVAQREAMLTSAQANLTRAQADLERVEEALKTNAVSQQEVALRRADCDNSQAAVMEAEANLSQAKLNLSYCDVTSPLSGQVSRNLVDVGNLVGSGDNTLLATGGGVFLIPVLYRVVQGTSEKLGGKKPATAAPAAPTATETPAG